MKYDDIYDAIAGEYYDVAHQTSRNFDQATLVALQDVKRLIPPEGLVLDVGCGKGRANEYLGIDFSRIVQLDSSKVMLELNPREACLLQLCHEAEILPFSNEQFTCITGFLCDPFLGLNFLGEAFRALKKNGLLVLTTPSNEWGQSLRSELQIDTDTTRFVVFQTGKIVIVPSNIFSPEEILKMLKHAGFDEQNIQLRRHKLPNGVTPISPDIIKPAKKLRHSSPYDLDILYSIIATK